MEANETQVVADLIDQLQRLHGYMTARRSANCCYFEDPTRNNGYVTWYPDLPDNLAHYQECLTLIYSSRYDDTPLLIYTGKEPPRALCLHFGWRSVDTIYTEEAVR